MDKEISRARRQFDGIYRPTKAWIAHEYWVRPVRFFSLFGTLVIAVAILAFWQPIRAQFASQTIRTISTPTPTAVVGRYKPLSELKTDRSANRKRPYFTGDYEVVPASQPLKIDTSDAASTTVDLQPAHAEIPSTQIREATETRTVGNQTLVEPKAGKPYAGLYKVTAKNQSGTVVKEETKAWGVLAFNPDYAIYPLGAPANLAFAVLDDRGKMVCDADMRVEILEPTGKKSILTTDDDGGILVNEDCFVYGQTDAPDYAASYQPGPVGTYKVTITARVGGGRRTLHDQFSVATDEHIYLERSGATRLYPPVPYEYTLTVHPVVTGPMTITEKVPGSFEIFDTKASVTSDNDHKTLTWEEEAIAGEPLPLTFHFRGPNISPYLFLFDPVQIELPSGQQWVEPRSWLLASDNACASNVASGNWNTSGSWTSCGGTVPQAADSVAILNTHTITLNTSPTILTIDIQNGGTLTNDGNARTLTLALTTGTGFTKGATGTFTPSTFISVTYSSNANFTVTSGTITFYNLTFNITYGSNTRTFTMGTGAITINNNWSITGNKSGGVNGPTFTVTMAAAVTVTNALSITATGGVAGQTNTVNLNTTGTNHALSAGSITLTDSSNNAATLTANASTISLTGTSGTLFTRGTGTFTQGTSTVEVTSASGTPTLLSGATTFHKLTINSAATSIAAGAAITMSSANAANTLAITSGVLDDGGNQITGTANGTMTIGSGGTLKLGSGTATTFPTNYTAGNITLDAASTVTYQSTSSQTVSAVPTYGHLTFGAASGTQTYTIGTATSQTLAIAGNWIAGSASTITVDWDTYDATINLAGNLTLSSTTTWTKSGTATFTFKPTGTKTWTDNNSTKQNLGIVTIGSGASTPKIQLGSAVKLQDLTISASHELDTVSGSNYAIEVVGNWTNSGTFTAQSGTVTFSSTATGKTLSGTLSGSTGKFYNLTFDGSGGGWTLGAATEAAGAMNVTNGTLNTHDTNSYSITVTGNFTMASGGTVDSNASTITVSGNWDQNNTTWNTAATGSGTSTVILSGSSKTLSTTGTGAGDRHFYNVTINGTYTKTLGERMNIYGNFIMNTSSSLSNIDFATGIHIWNGSATVTINGTLSKAGFNDGSMWIRTSMPTITSSVGIGVRVDYVIGSAGTHVIPALDYNGGLYFNSTETNTYRLGSGTFNIPSTDTGWTIQSGTTAKTLTLDNDTNDATVNVTLNVDFVSAVGSTTANLGSASYNVGQSWINTDGATVDPGTSTVTFSNDTADGDITSASQSFYNVIIDDTADDITPLDALSITNDLTLTAGEINSAQNVTVNGNVSGTAGFTNFSGGTFTQRVAANKNFGATTGSTAWTFSSLTFSNSHGSSPFTITTQTGGTGGINVTSVLRVGASGDSAGATTTLNAGNRTWTLSGTGGDPFQILASPLGVLSGGTSKFYYTGANAGGNTTIQASASSYYDLEINASDTFVLEGATLVSNNLTITTGTLDVVFGQDYPLSIGGNYSNSGTFTAQGGTVTFTATDAGNTLSGTLDGSSNFYHLTFNGSGGDWTPGSAMGVGGDLTVTAGSLLGTSNISVEDDVIGPGTITLTSPSVMQMAGENGSGSDFGTTSGSNNWTFYDLTLRASTSALFTTQTGGSGGITVSHVLTLGDVVDETVTLDAGNRTWTLSGTTGTPINNASGVLTANASTFAYTGNNGSGNTTIESFTYWNLTLNASETFVLEANTDIDNNLTITTGTLDAVSGSNYDLAIGGNYSNSGTFTARSGEVVFNGTDTGNTLGGTLNGSSAFYDLTFNGSGGDWTPSAAVLVTNDLTMTAGSLLGTQNATVNRHVAGTAGIINLTGGTFDQAIASDVNFGTTSGSAAWTFYDLTFSYPCSGFCADGGYTVTTQTGGTGTITVTDVLKVGKSGDGDKVTLNAGNRTWTLSGTTGDPFQILASPAGVLTAATSTFTYTGNYASDDTIVQVATYYNLIINNGSETYVLEGNTSAGNDVTITAGTLALSGFTLTITNDLSVAGTLSGANNVSVAGGDATGNGTINLTGGTFTITGTGNFGGDTAWTFNGLVIGASGGSASTITATGTGGMTIGSNLSITARFSGTNVLQAGSKTWTLSSAGGTPFCSGGILIGATLTAQTSEFVYTGNNSGGNTTVCSQWSYYKLTINNSSETFDLMGHTTIANNLTITAGTLDAVSGSNFNLTVGGNFAVAGTFTPRNDTVTLNGSAQQTVSDTNSGTNTFYALTITNTSGTSDPGCGGTFFPGVIFSNPVTTTNTFTITIASVKVRYNSGSAYAFNNINWNGQAAGTRLEFCNSNLGSGTWLLNVTAAGSAQTKVSYVNVARSDASSGSTIIASDGTNVDSGNNTNWQFDETLTLSLDSTSKSFGVIQPGSNPSDQTTTLTATSNSSTGYVIYAWCTQLMTETRGYGTISDWTGTNGTPTAFSNPSTGFGYTTDDASLTGGTADRFTNGGAKYAGFTHAGPGDPVADRTSAATGTTNTVSYRLYPSATAANGDYTTTVIYIITAAFP